MKPEVHDWGPSEGSSFRVETFTYTYSAGWHYNTEYQLTHLIEGSGTQFVGDDIRAFGPGNMVFLAPGLPHRWHNPDHPLPRPRTKPIGLAVLQLCPVFTHR